MFDLAGKVALMAGIARALFRGPPMHRATVGLGSAACVTWKTIQVDHRPRMD